MQCHKPSPKSQFLWVQLQASPHGSCSWQPGFPTLIIRITIPTPFIIIIKLFNAIILIKKNVRAELGTHFSCSISPGYQRG